MRTSQRVVAVAALGLPLLLASPVMALAGGHHKPHIHQTEVNKTEQSNENHSPVVQLNLGSGHQENNAVVKPDLSNENATWQDQHAD